MYTSTRRLLNFSLIKYLNREILVGFIIGTLSFLFIILLFQLVRLSDFMVGQKVSFTEMSTLSFYLICSVVPIAIPMAFLFSIIFGISRAHSEGEIMALQISGISLKQILIPLLIFSFFLCVVCIYFSLYFAPKANRAFELLISRLGSEKVISHLKPHVFNEQFFGLVIFAKDISPIERELKKVFIYDERESELPLTISARTGHLIENSNGGFTLRLLDGDILIDRKGHSEILQRIGFKVYDIYLEIAEKAEVWRSYTPPSYTYSQLLGRIKETVHDIPEHRQLLLELHRRFALPFSCCVFSILGFFIALVGQRGVRSTAIIICLLVGVCYWLSYVIANALVVKGGFLPYFSVWFPNIIFGYIGWRFYKISRK